MTIILRKVSEACRSPRFTGWERLVLPLLLLAAAVFGEAGIQAGEGVTVPVSASPRPAPQKPAAPAPLIELDGTISISPDGSELAYDWKQISGPPVELSDPTSPKPFFRTSRPGVYEFQLVVTADGLSSEPHIVRLEIEHENLPPVAKIPLHATGQVGKLLEVDGRQSFDPEGQNLLYRWRPLTPGLDIPLSALSMPVLAFEPQAGGDFEVELVVSDGEKNSEPAVCRLTIRSKPRPPVAQARIIASGGAQPRNSADQAAARRPAHPIAQVKAIPSPVKPPPPQPVTTARITAPTSAPEPIPPAASVALMPPPPLPPAPPGLDAAPLPPLPPLPDENAWTPSVQAVQAHSQPKPAPAVSIPAISIPPLSALQEAEAGAPMMSSAGALHEPSPMAPPAQPATPRYDVMAAPTTMLSFNHSRFAARIRGPKIAEVGREVVLDAREVDGGSGQLHYAWTQKRGAEITAKEMMYGGGALRIYAPVAGTYEFEVLVTDSEGRRAPATHTVRFTDEKEPPIAVVVAPTRAQLGALVMMDATQSYDIGGEKLLYRWRQTGGPVVRNYVIDERYGDSSPAFYPPSPGMYSFELIVSNGELNSRPVDIDIEVMPTVAQPPIQARIVGPEQARVGDRIVLSADVGEGVVGRNVSFHWRQTAGPADALTPSSGVRAGVVAVQTGRYVFEVTVLEDGEAVHSAALEMEILPPDAVIHPTPAPIPAPASQAQVKPPSPAVGAPYIGPASQQAERGAEERVPPPGAIAEVSVGSPRRVQRVPEIMPLPGVPRVPDVTAFPEPTLPGGKGRPAATVLTGKPPLADL